MFNKKRKGVELSINMMIVIVLALLVLIIGVYFIMKGGTAMNNGTDCVSNGGNCMDKGQTCSGEKPILAAYSCPSDKGVCCIPFGSKG